MTVARTSPEEKDLLERISRQIATVVHGQEESSGRVWWLQGLAGLYGGNS